MTETTRSGRGRNGPWLQNSWLRVETRLDDGTISPIALGTAFRPSERVGASLVDGDGDRLALERCDYDLQSHADSLGAGLKLTLTSWMAQRGLTLRREVLVYDDHQYCLTRLGVDNGREDPVRLTSLHAFTSAGGARGGLQLKAMPEHWRVYRNGWQSWSPTMSLGGSQRDVQSRPPELSPESAQTDTGRFASDDLGILFDPVSGNSLLAGAVTARDFITQVLIDVSSKSVDARNLCDGIPVEPGEQVWSEWFLVDVVGHPNDQLARYGDALGAMMGARRPKVTPSGWCSWYYFYTEVTESDVMRNLRFLESHRRELPVETVQIDDGYQADIGDWLVTNEKFPRGMKWLANEIKDAGYTPGIWLAPFIVAATSRTFAEHPGFVLRTSEGTPVVANHNWGHDNFGLDGSNPDVKAWLEDLFRQICDGWGYDYVKIDFLFGGALQGLHHDQQATRVRAYRQALDAVRRGVGPERFILGCGSLMAPSVGYFDGNRIGPDCAPFWRFLTREERAAPALRPRTPDDLLSTETAMRNTVNRWWMHNRLWANDPDCLLVRTDRTKMTLDEVRTMATVIGLSGSMTLSSDDLDKLPEDRLALLAMTIPPLPVSASPPDIMMTDMPDRFEVEYARPYDPMRLVGLFNFTDEARDLMLDLPDGQWHVFEQWEERYRGVNSGSVTFDLVPPHAARLVALRPADGRPRVVATNAHVGMGVLDVLDQEYDDVRKELRFQVAPVGREVRTIWVGGGDVLNAAADGESIAHRAGGGGSTALNVRVAGPATIVITFST